MVVYLWHSDINPLLWNVKSIPPKNLCTLILKIWVLTNPNIMHEKFQKVLFKVKKWHRLQTFIFHQLQHFLFLLRKYPHITPGSRGEKQWHSAYLSFNVSLSYSRRILMLYLMLKRQKSMMMRTSWILTVIKIYWILILILMKISWILIAVSQNLIIISRHQTYWIFLMPLAKTMG